MKLDSPHMIPLLLAAGGLLLLSSRRASTFSVYAGIPFTEKDVDATARMLIAETSFFRDPEEMAQIVWVAINRAKQKGNPVFMATTPPGVPNWNASEPYRRMWVNGHNNPRFEAAKDFVRNILLGKPAATSKSPAKLRPNRIGNRVQFLHPHGMKKCTTSADCGGRTCEQTIKGPRCLPGWSTTAQRNVVTIGGARFS